MLDFNRTTFEIPMVEEFFTVRGLVAQTGQSAENMGVVAIKELVDNGIDAAEFAGVQPEIGISLTCCQGFNLVTVTDNGAGINPETIERILNFQTRTSDKSVYRTPSRGAQGNALKTLIGMPHAFGIDEPVVIESMGVRNSIRAWLDPSGKLRIEHNKDESAVVSGTSASVPVPPKYVNISKLIEGFSLFNPHVSFLVKIEKSDPEINHGKSEKISSDFYQNTAGDGWKKFTTKDMPSVHWYDLAAFKRLVYCHITESDVLLRDFIMNFRGLSSTGKAKSICSRFNHKRLSDFDMKDEDIAMLFDEMKEASKIPKPDILGIIGEDHFRSRFNDIFGGFRKFFYRKRLFEISGVPYVAEMAIAKALPECSGGLFAGVNFSPSYGDPIYEYFDSGQMGLYSLFGLKGELTDDNDIVMAFHLVSPSLNFKDRGKTALALSNNAKDEIGGLIWDTSKELYQDKKRMERNERAAIRAEENALKESRISFKEAVFHVLPAAYQKATGGEALPTTARQLFYQVRPLIQEYTDKELDYGYFSQTLLTEYRQTIGGLNLLLYDPRGVLYEPHSGKSIPLGTRQVDSYQFPSWLYDKILYIEKKGFWPVLEATHLAEKYDMAIVVGEGYSCEAVRVLFDKADKSHGYKIMVLHDADPDGYEICRTLSEETKRMPGYSVEVIDLGLNLQYALSIGLETETFIRKKSLPSALELSPIEEDIFTGEMINKKAYRCERIELNAFTSSQIIEYIDTKLAEHGVTEKVIPDEKSLADLTRNISTGILQGTINDIIHEMLSVESISKELQSKYLTDINRQMIETQFDADRTISWRSAVKSDFINHLRSHADSLRQDVFEAIQRQFNN